MGRRDQAPKKGEIVRADFLGWAEENIKDQTAARGDTREVAGVSGMRKPLQPFLAIVTEQFAALGASDSPSEACLGRCRKLFLDKASDQYDLTHGDEFDCYSHHFLPVFNGAYGDERVWVIFNEQSGRFEILATSPGQIIRFRFIEFTADPDPTANVTVLSSMDGRMLGETIHVVDATDESCYFGDETEAELVDRTGYAAWMQFDDASGNRNARFEVYSLCCPPAGSS